MARKSMVLFLLLAVLGVLALAGCGGDHADSPYYAPPNEQESEYVDTFDAEYDAAGQGETDGHEAGRAAFLQDPENSPEYADAPDDGGYSTEAEQDAYDELVERYQQEYPEGD